VFDLGVRIKKMKRFILILTIISAVITVLSIVNDPFSIPFQDWDQMPKERQDMYLERSEDMKKIKSIFGICFLTGASYLLISLILEKRKRKEQ